MENNIQQLKTILESIEQKLPTDQESTEFVEKKAQLQSIEKSINSFTRTNVSVPPEIREAKFRILSEIDEYKKKHDMALEVRELLLQWVTRNEIPGIPKTKAKIRTGEKRSNRVFNVTIKNLVDAGYLQPSMKFFRNYHGIECEAIITHEGKLRSEINGKLTDFKSPSAPAMAVAQKPQNGWKWWYIMFEGKKRDLDYFRQKYLNV